MSTMKRQARINLALSVVEQLSDQPKSLAEIAKTLGTNTNKLWHTFLKLKAAKLIVVSRGVKGGLSRVKNLEVTDLDIRRALGYPMPAVRGMATCHFCGEEAPRISKARPDGSYVYVDDTDLQWVGRRCPDCVHEQHTKQLEEEALTDRKCRGCGEFLTKSRYFKCADCQPSLGLVDDEFIYHGIEVGVGELGDLGAGIYEDLDFEPFSKGGNNEPNKDEETGARSKASDTSASE